MGYTKDQITEAISAPGMLYQKEAINYAGKTNKVYYTEIIAEYILSNLSTKSIYELLGIGQMEKRKDFRFLDHIKKEINLKSNRREENLCFTKHRENSPWGQVINYQINIVPNTKISADLVARDEKRGTLTIVEVKGYDKGKYPNIKAPSSTETLLRCILEVQTYYLLLINNKEVLLKTLTDSEDIVKTEPDDTLKKGIWLSCDSRAWGEYKELDSGKRENLKKLLQLWDISVHCYN